MSLMKRLTLWRARGDVGSEEALRRWQEDHVVLVERVPGLERYRQTLCTEGPRRNTGKLRRRGRGVFQGC